MIATLLILCLARAASSAPETFEVRRIGSDPFAAASVELAADGTLLKVDAGAAAQQVPVSNVVRIDVAGETVRFEADADVLLADGSRFLARLQDGVEDSLAIETPAIGRSVIPLELVAAVTFGASSKRGDPTRLGAGNDDEDVVYRRGRGEGDRLSGTLAKLGRDGIKIASNLGEVAMSIGDAAGVTIANEAPSIVSGAGRVEVELREGGFLRGKLLALGSQALSLETSFAARVEIAMPRVSSVRFGGDRFVWLSDLEPSKVEQTPWLGEPAEFLFSWRRDLSVTGQPLTIAKERFGKGLGLHSRARLTWQLEGKYAAFQAEAGICDEVLGHGIAGSVIVRVLVDGQVVHESGVLRGGAKAAPIPAIDLKGKQELRVEVDFADEGDVGDRAAIVDPLLVRSD